MTAILIVAHAPLASALKAVAVHAYAECASQVQALDVLPETPVDEVEAQARALLRRAEGAPALIFVDVFGATPCNAAMRLLDQPATAVVAGVNVPMLWRTLCYGAREPLDALVARAITGATQGVMRATFSRPQNQAGQPGRHDHDPSQDQQ